MGEEIKTLGEDSRAKSRINKGSIKRVANGFVIEGFDFQTKIANTLDEALALLRKELE